MNVVEIKDLVKKYGDFTALDHVDLAIEEGEVYGLLGPNGAGKSTLINILSGILGPTYGVAKLLGTDVRKNSNDIKKKLGVVPQHIALYDNYTAYENVKLFGELYGFRGKELESKVDSALEFTGLLDVKKKLAKEFSGGMLRRLNIACALVHSPKVIIMDEPTVGIDPQSRNHILDSVKKLNEQGVTIIYTSHYMEEVEQICTRLAIIDNGQVIVEGTKDEVKSIVSDKNNLVVTVNNTKGINVDELKEIKGVERINIEENKVTISSKKEINNLDKVINYFASSDIKINNVSYEDINLEMVFLSLTGKKLRD